MKSQQVIILLIACILFAASMLLVHIFLRLPLRRSHAICHAIAQGHWSMVVEHVSLSGSCDQWLELGCASLCGIDPDAIIEANYEGTRGYRFNNQVCEVLLLQHEKQPDSYLSDIESTTDVLRKRVVLPSILNDMTGEQYDDYLRFVKATADTASDAAQIILVRADTFDAVVHVWLPPVGRQCATATLWQRGSDADTVHSMQFLLTDSDECPSSTDILWLLSHYRMR